MLSPDASLLLLERWQALAADERRGFTPLCPDLVVVLASPSDEGPRGLSALRHKMAAYQANGALLGWLLIPYDQPVEVWPSNGAPHRLVAAEVFDASAEFLRLQLNLAEI